MNQPAQTTQHTLIQRGLRRSARQLGFTLIETMVALGVAGTLAAIGLPGLSQFHDKAAVEAQVEGFTSALRRARSEAVSRGELVTVCALDADSVEAGEPDCVAEGKAWSAGWLVFVDHGDRGEVGEGDKVITIVQAPANTGGAVGTQRYLTYRSSGELLSIAAHFRFLPPGAELKDVDVPGAALVCVNKPGRPRLATEGVCRG